jgi:hypothetical protein
MDATETSSPVWRGSVSTDNSTTVAPTKTKLTLSSSLLLLYIDNTKSGKDRGFDRRDIWLKVTLTSESCNKAPRYTQIEVTQFPCESFQVFWGSEQSRSIVSNGWKQTLKFAENIQVEAKGSGLFWR